MLVGNLIDFRKEQAAKEEWQPKSRIRAYCDAQYSEFKQDQDQYQKKYKVFNDRTPSQYFILAEEDAYKYVEPSVDPNDWKNFIRSGEERNKLDGLLSFLLDLNFQVEPEARDFAGAINPHAGEIGEAYIRYLNILDEAEAKNPLTDFAMFTHGTVFKQIQLHVKKTLHKSIAEWDQTSEIDKYRPKLTEEEEHTFIDSRLLKPNRVYLTDISKMNMAEQDHVWYEAVVSYAMAYRMFHTWSQWKYVKPYNATVDAWTDSPVDIETESKEVPDKVRIKWRESETTNELSIYCNKVLMTPLGLKLPEGRYSIFYQQASTLHPFMAYGRSFMDNVRTFVGVKDVLTSVLVDTARQIPEPPMKSRLRTMVNRYMFRPGAVTPMQGDGDLTPLIPQSAMQNFVFEAIKVYDDMINKSSISPVFQGQATKAQMTKYEVEQQLMQSIRAVASMVGAAMNWRRQQAKLQLHVGLSHIEDITNFRFEAAGALNEISKIVELKDVPDTRKRRYDALNALMKAEGIYRKSGQRKKFYVTSPNTLRKEYSFMINYRVNPQQRSSKSGDEKEIVDKIGLYRGAPTANQRAVDKLLVRMFGDEEDDMLLPEQPQGAGISGQAPPSIPGQPSPVGIPTGTEPEPGTRMPQFAEQI